MFPGKLVRPTAAHIAELAANMQEADVQECWALGRMKPFEAISVSVMGSRDTRCWIVNGKVVTIFGVGTDVALTDYGVPWLLATSKVQELSRPFLRGSKIIAEQWKKEHRILRNWVDSRHKLAVRWIEWMGFDLKPAVPMGPDQIPFHKFEWVRPNEHTTPPAGA